jgi:hypothetical protein
VKAEGEAPAIIVAHPFTPQKDRPWMCAYVVEDALTRHRCNLGEAAHATSVPVGCES